jgi:hypothetical protein
MGTLILFLCSLPPLGVLTVAVAPRPQNRKLNCPGNARGDRPGPHRIGHASDDARRRAGSEC